MQDKKHFHDQQDSNSNQQNAGKNETLNDPGADVVDYGRSEQQSIESAQKDRNEHSNETPQHEEKK